MISSRPLSLVVDDVIDRTEALHAEYCDRHVVTQSPATQVLIECHIEQLDHALRMLRETRDILAAEQEWGATPEKTGEHE